MKTCSRCRKRKPKSAFYRSKKSSDGLRYACIECETNASREYQKAGPNNKNVHTRTSLRKPEQLVESYGLGDDEMRAVRACEFALDKKTGKSAYQIALEASDDEDVQTAILACAIAFHREREEEAVA